MSPRRIRPGELVAALGAALVVVALLEPWYETQAFVKLDAWDTFGPTVVLLLLATAGALWMLLTALAERSTTFPVAAGVWAVPLALAGLVCAIVRVIERPDHASRLCAGPWLALAGAVAILLGAWLSIRDERGSLYPPANPETRPRP